jgi:hypothetical protein
MTAMINWVEKLTPWLVKRERIGAACGVPEFAGQ